MYLHNPANWEETGMTVITVHCVNISGKSISLQADTMDNYGSFKTGAVSC